jgi:2-methylisocitrate lyase-like PEP mutase family enzyme
MGFGIRACPTTPLLCAKELQDVGVAVASYPRLATSAALMGIPNAQSVLKQSVEAKAGCDTPGRRQQHDVDDNGPVKPDHDVTRESRSHGGLV